MYRATDAVLARTVAVKVLLAGLAEEDPAYIARFQREARAAAALHNRAVVAVYDVGVDEDMRFIVMEHVKGRSLAALLSGGKPLPLRESLRIGEQVASALGAAHGGGIVHRDIKPANVMVADDGAVKVLDFGLARMLDGTTITQAASVLGPPPTWRRNGRWASRASALGHLLARMPPVRDADRCAAVPFRASRGAAAPARQFLSAPAGRPARGRAAGAGRAGGGHAREGARGPAADAKRVGERLRAMAEPADPTAPTARPRRRAAGGERCHCTNAGARGPANPRPAAPTGRGGRIGCCCGRTDCGPAELEWRLAPSGAAREHPGHDALCEHRHDPVGPGRHDPVGPRSHDRPDDGVSPEAAGPGGATRRTAPTRQGATAGSR